MLLLRHLDIRQSRALFQYVTRRFSICFECVCVYGLCSDAASRSEYTACNCVVVSKN